MNEFLYRIAPSLRVIGSSASPPAWVEPMRCIYDHELVLFADCDYRVEFAEVRIPCPANSFIIVPPGRRHTTVAMGNRSGRRGWIHFDWEFRERHDDDPIFTYAPAACCRESLRPAPEYLPPPYFFGNLRDPEEAWEYHARLDALFNRGSTGDRLLARGVLLELLVKLLYRPDAKELTAAGRQADHRASVIRRRLEEYARLPFRDAPGIQDFLADTGQSYAHACRIFHRQYGIAPLSYVHELRMTRARQLLRDAHLSVAETAERLGFNQPGYFARLFRKSTGVAPREYRQRGTGNQPDQ